MPPMHDGDYARTTITVPKMLKRRMKLQGLQVNWSAVACAAFRAKLEELKEKQQGVQAGCASMTKEQAIERLRLLKQGAPTAACSSPGYVAGQVWAMKHAHPQQLQRLGELVQSPEFERAQQRPHKFVRGITAAILGIHPCEAQEQQTGGPRGMQAFRRQARQFWENQAGASETPPPLGFARDFALGASDFWTEIREKL